MMSHSDWFYFLIFGGIFGFLFFLMEVIYLRFKISVELTRKLLHVIIGVISAGFCYLFEGYLAVLILAFLFYLLLGLGKRFNFMKCIHDVKRKSYGGALFPISLWLVFFLNKLADSPYYYFEVSILILSISDSVATLGGLLIPENFLPGRKLNTLVLSETKTRLGSLFFLSSSFLIVLFSIMNIPDLTLNSKYLLILVLPVIATTIEAFSKKGWDNLFIPVGTWLFFILAEKII
jgi:phytol kinase